VTIKNKKSMIGGKIISRFKFTLHKVEKPMDWENVNR
jgi:hypothetical protein